MHRAVAVAIFGCALAIADGPVVVEAQGPSDATFVVQEGTATRGTAFLIRSNSSASYFLTASHVVDSIPEGQLGLMRRSHATDRYPAEVIVRFCDDFRRRCHEGADIALLRATGRTFSTSPLDLGLGEEPTMPGLEYAGFPAGQFQLAGPTNASVVRRDGLDGALLTGPMLRSSIELVSGFSGGPLVRRDSRLVVGVVSRIGGETNRPGYHTPPVRVARELAAAIPVGSGVCGAAQDIAGRRRLVDVWFEVRGFSNLDLYQIVALLGKVETPSPIAMEGGAECLIPPTAPCAGELQQGRLRQIKAHFDGRLGATDVWANALSCPIESLESALDANDRSARAVEAALRVRPEPSAWDDTYALRLEMLETARMLLPIEIQAGFPEAWEQPFPLLWAGPDGRAIVEVARYGLRTADSLRAAIGTEDSLTALSAAVVAEAARGWYSLAAIALDSGRDFSTSVPPAMVGDVYIGLADLAWFQQDTAVATRWFSSATDAGYVGEIPSRSGLPAEALRGAPAFTPFEITTLSTEAMSSGASIAAAIARSFFPERFFRPFSGRIVSD